MYPKELKYTQTHEWVRKNSDGTYTVGITYHAEQQLGDITYVELPAVGTQIAQNGETGSVESVKAVSDIFAPVGGTVSAVNNELESHPEWVNQEPYGKGWFYTLTDVEPAQFDALMDAEAYRRFLAEDHA